MKCIMSLYLSNVDVARDRFAGVLMTLREDDKKALLEDETTELVCHYCNEKYHFSREELEDMFVPKGLIQ